MVSTPEDFLAMAHAAPDAIVVADGRGLLTYVNPAAGRLFGAPPERLVGQPLAGLLGAGEGDEAPVVPPAGEGRAPSATLQRTGLRADGTEFPLELSVWSWAGRDGPAHGAVLRDTTARRRGDEERLAALERLREVERLRELDRFKNEFMDIAAHELRTPLTPLRTELHLLRQGRHGPLSPEQARAVEVIQRNLVRLQGLIDDVLDVSRLQSNRLGIQVAPVDLRALARDAAEACRDAARDGGVALVAEPGPPLVARADARRLGQVLLNLLANAIKFTPAGGEVRIAAAGEGPEAVVQVRDTGIGADPEVIAGLFRAFAPVRNPVRAGQAGTGLGLYLCRGIIELHQGRIWCESPGAGRGATFRFAIPLAGPRLAAESPAATRAA